MSEPTLHQSLVPGITAKHAIVTPTCRASRGVEGAFDEAVKRLREEYIICAGLECNATANFHLVLTVERSS